MAENIMNAKLGYLVISFGLVAIFAAPLASFAGQSSAAELRFENHRFTPPTLTVPAGHALAITVVNASNEPIEFESFKLNRERAIEPGTKAIVRLPSLSAGSYDFYDDLHQDVPNGSIVAK
jgi:Cupredoxin-like domain